MQESLTELRLILDKIWQQRRIVAIVSFVACMVGWFGVTLLPDEYRAQTSVYVDTSTMLSRTLKGLAVESEDIEGEFVNVSKSLLLSRPNLEKVARDNDMFLTASDAEEEEEVLQELMEIDLRARSTSDTRSQLQNIISISYDHEDPEVAYGVVTSLLDIFLESILGSNQQGAESTEKFLTKKIAEYKSILEQAEDRLKNFKRRNIGLLPNEGTSYFREIQQTKDKLQDSELLVTQLERNRSELRRQIRDLSSSQGSAGGNPVNTRLNDLEDRLVDLLLQYTEDHPDVVSLRRTIRDLKNGLSGSALDVDAASLSGNRVIEELRVELGKVEASLASEQARLDSFRLRLTELEDSADTIPDIEAEHTKLTRDYEVIKSQYEELLTRLEATRLSKERDISEGDVVFRVVEPPTIPLLPVGPARAQLASMVLLAGLGLGLAVGFLLNLLRPTFANVTELEEEFGLTALGAVSLAEVSAQDKRSLMVYGAMFAGLLVVYLVYLAIVLF